MLTLSGCDHFLLQKDNTTIPIISAEEKTKITTEVEQQKKNLSLCNQEQDQALSGDAVNVYYLSETKYLVEILCFLGAYQGNYQYLLLSKPENNWRKINFSTFDFQAQNFKLANTDTLVGSIDFEPVTQVLTVETKSRGLGDCGSYAQYQWVDNSQFELKEYRYKAECDGVYLQPENYPLIYP